MCIASSAAAEPKKFLPKSMEQIVNARIGQPFLLILWSVDCPPCMKELVHLQQLKKQFKNGSIVLVSTDSPDMQKDVIKILADHELLSLENWLFDSNFSERLRFQVDPNWYGELPRAYFYNADHQRLAHSGTLSLDTLNRWLKQTAISSAPKQTSPQ